jgi:hypothetical protein
MRGIAFRGIRSFARHSGAGHIMRDENMNLVQEET